MIRFVLFFLGSGIEYDLFCWKLLWRMRRRWNLLAAGEKQEEGRKSKNQEEEEEEVDVQAEKEESDLFSYFLSDTTSLLSLARYYFCGSV